MGMNRGPGGAGGTLRGVWGSLESGKASPEAGVGGGGLDHMERRCTFQVRSLCRRYRQREGNWYRPGGRLADDEIQSRRSGRQMSLGMHVLGSATFPKRRPLPCPGCSIVAAEQESQQRSLSLLFSVLLGARVRVTVLPARGCGED